jgi:hypothetical protein
MIFSHWGLLLGDCAVGASLAAGVQGHFGAVGSHLLLDMLIVSASSRGRGACRKETRHLHL